MTTGLDTSRCVELCVGLTSITARGDDQQVHAPHPAVRGEKHAPLLDDKTLPVWDRSYNTQSEMSRRDHERFIPRAARADVRAAGETCGAVRMHLHPPSSSFSPLIFKHRELIPLG